MEISEQMSRARNNSPAWWVIFLLFSGTFINAIDRASLSTAAPLLQKDLHLDDQQLGFALSAFFWLYTVMNIPAGRLADKWGAKRCLGWAAVLWSACSALTGAAGGLWQLIAARAGVGAGEAASFPVNAKIVNNTFAPDQRGVAVAFYTAGLRLGFAVTPMLIAWLMVHYGWRFAFYATGLGSLGWVVVWYFTYHANGPAGTGAPRRVPALLLLQNRTVVGLVLCKFFQDYLFYFFVAWLPSYLISSRGFSILKMGVYASLPWIAGCIFQPLAGWFSDVLIRRGVSVTVSRKSIVVLMQLLATVVIAAAYVDDARTAVWLLTASVACESAATAILWTTCTDVAPPADAGSLAGIMNTAGAVAGILAPSVTGILATRCGGFQVPMLVGGTMVALAAASMLFVVGELRTVDLLPQPEKHRVG